MNQRLTSGPGALDLNHNRITVPGVPGSPLQSKHRISSGFPVYPTTATKRSSFNLYNVRYNSLRVQDKLTLRTMDCCPTYLLFFSDQYWRPFVYPSTALPFIHWQTRGNIMSGHGWPVATVHARRRGKRVTRPTNNHDIEETHVTGVERTSTKLHSTQAASSVRGVGPQPWLRDATSSDGQPHH